MVSPKLRKAFKTKRCIGKTKRCIGICQERWEKVSFIKLGLIYFSFMHFVRSCRSVAPGLMDDMPSIRIVQDGSCRPTAYFFFVKSWRRQYKIAFAINSSSIYIRFTSLFNMLAFIVSTCFDKGHLPWKAVATTSLAFYTKRRPRTSRL